MLTPLPGVQVRMLLLGISAKKRRPSAHTGPSIQVKPVTMRSSLASAGMILSTDASRRSILSGVRLSALAAEACDGSLAAAELAAVRMNEKQIMRTIRASRVGREMRFIGIFLARGLARSIIGSLPAVPQVAGSSRKSSAFIFSFAAEGCQGKSKCGQSTGGDRGIRAAGGAIALWAGWIYLPGARRGSGHALSVVRKEARDEVFKSAPATRFRMPASSVCDPGRGYALP